MARKIALYLFLGIFLLPFVSLLIWSLSSAWFYPAILPGQWTLDSWRRMPLGFGEALGNSVSLALLVGSSATAAGFVTAAKLSAHRYSRTLLLLSYLPYAFSPVIFAHCIKYFFLASGLAGHFGGVLCAQFILCYPFAFLFFFRHFDPNLRALAQLSATLGASGSVVWWKVLVPVSRKALILCFLQCFLISWFEYGLSWVIGLGQLRTLTIVTYYYMGEANLPMAAVSACLICLPPLFFLLLPHKKAWA